MPSARACRASLAGERDKYRARSTSLTEEVAELNTELEDLYDRHGHIKRQLLVLRHANQAP